MKPPGDHVYIAKALAIKRQQALEEKIKKLRTAVLASSMFLTSIESRWAGIREYDVLVGIIDSTLKQTEGDS